MTVDPFLSLRIDEQDNQREVFYFTITLGGIAVAAIRWPHPFSGPGKSGRAGSRGKVSAGACAVAPCIDPARRPAVRRDSDLRTSESRPLRYDSEGKS